MRTDMTTSATKPVPSRWQRAETPPAGHLLDLLVQATRLLEVHPDLVNDRSVESSLRRLAGAARDARKADSSPSGRKEIRP